MPSTLHRPVEMGREKKYRFGNHTFGVISAEAMGYIEAAHATCGNDPQKLLEIASDAARGNDQVQIDLYAYGRFEFNISPEDLRGIFQERMVDMYSAIRQIRRICTEVAKYRVRKGLTIPQ